MNYSVTKYGKPLDKSLYIIDEKNKTFSTKGDYLVLDFTGLDGWSFKTGFGCVFITFSRCIFETEEECTFHTDGDCIFNTGGNCTFNTSRHCTFITGNTCVFKTGWNCIFDTGCNCSFNIFNDFNKIKTKGNSNILIRDKKIHTHLKDEVEIYFDKKNNEILYTENKLTKDKYLMMRELRK